MTTERENELRDSLQQAARRVEVQAPSLAELQHRAAATAVPSSPARAGWMRPQMLAPLALGVALIGVVVGIAMLGPSDPDASVVTVNEPEATATPQPTAVPQSALPEPTAEPELSPTTGEPDPPPTAVPQSPVPEPATADDSEHHIFVHGAYIVTGSDAGWRQQVPDRNDAATAGVVSLDSGESLSTDGWGEAELCSLDPQVGPVKPTVSLGTFHPGVAVSGVDFDPRPRPFVEVAPEPAHIDAVRSVLQEQDHPDPVGAAIDPQVLRFDLEGDGVDEVLILANGGERQAYLSTIGTYSVGVLRRLIDGVVQNKLLHATVTTGNEPYLEDRPEVPEISEDLVSVVNPLRRLIDIVDLNGDGHMEIVAEVVYFESSVYSILEFDTSTVGPYSWTLGCGP